MASKKMPRRRVWISTDAHGTARGIFFTKKFAIEDALSYGIGEGWSVTGPYVLAGNGRTQQVTSHITSAPRQSAAGGVK